MKKLIALLLSLMLLVGIALPVMAEEAPHRHTIAYDDTMSVEVVIPDNYAVEEINASGALLLVMTPLDESKNYFCTLIAQDEDNADVERLNDLSDEAIQAIADDFCADLNNPAVSFAETGMGTKLIVIDDNDGDGDTVIILTLYKGYFLTTYVFPAGETVTEEEKNMAIQFYTDMEFMF